MTTTQPGQEQRMELKPCPFCGGDRLVESYIRAGAEVRCLGHGCGASIHRFLPNALPKARTAWNTRPTADLGDDGELERHARQMRESLNDELPNGVGNTIDALLDRLILYREALEDAAAFIRGDISGQSQRDGILREIDAVLSRSA